MRRALFVVAALACLAGACGNDPSAPEASSAKALASAIRQRDVGCTDFTAGASSSGPGGDAGACTVNGKQINLAVYRSEQARDRGTIERFKGCIARRSFNATGTDAFAYLRGPTWIIVSADKATVRRVANALHTDVQTAPC